MTSGGTQPQQTTTTVLGPEQQQLFKMAMPGLTQFAANTPQRYQGDTVAGFTPNQTEGSQAMIDAARTGSATTVNALTGALKSAADFPSTLDPNVNKQPLATSSDIFSDPGIWNPAANPGVSAAITAAQRPLYENLQQQILPNLRGEAIQTGGIGGSRQGVAEGLASGKTQTAAADQAAQIAQNVYGANLNAVNQRYGTNIAAENQRYATDIGADQARYGTNVNATLQALGLTPTLASGITGAAIQPGAIQTGVGEQQQALNQARLNAQIQGYNYDQLAPFLQSKEILSLVQGMPGSTAVSTGNNPQANPLTTALGGAATGAAVGSAIPGIGTAVGAGVGGGAALLPFLFNK
jgi:hypothetical protein